VELRLFGRFLSKAAQEKTLPEKAIE